MKRDIQNGQLYWDGCSAQDLAETYGTPLYVFSQSAIEAECRAIRDCFLSRYENTRAAYAAKAFSCLGIFRLMEREGFCLDVVSGGELYAALQAQFPPERIEFNGNNKQPEELEMAVEAGVGRIIIDGLDELPIIEELCRAKGRRMKVLYRITPGVKGDSHDYIVTGKKDSKFGVPIDEDILLPYIKAAIDSEYVDFLGLHFHVGSQLMDNAAHIKALEVLLGVMERVKEEYGFTMTELNLGGGFGIQYLPDQARSPYSYFLEPLMERIEAFSRKLGVSRPAVVIEPGRAIVGEAGMTLYRVGTTKEVRGVRKYVAVDGGMTDNIRPALYQAQYHAAIDGRAEDRDTETVTVCGKCCESGDVLIKDIALPHPRRGDLLCVFSTGAYGYSMSSNYNRLPKPAAVLCKDGRSALLIRRETYADLCRGDEIPDSLK